MKPQELRIGNYVYYEHTIHVISGIMGNKIYSWWVKDGEPVIEYEAKDVSGTQVENPYMDVISRHEPIPLTEEWLIKLGFKRDELNGHYYPTWRRFIPIYKRGYYYNFNGISLNCKDFEYVHELQNLYFALTGEELTIK